MIRLDDFGFDDSWLIPESAMDELEQTIQASGDLEQAKAAASKIAEMRYGNAILHTAIATATGQESEYDDDAVSKLCSDANKTAEEFAADLADISKVVTTRLALNKKIAEIFDK